MALFPLGILSAAGAGPVGPTFQLISTQIVSGSSTSIITFDVSNLASNYRHLQIRYAARSSANQIWDSGILRFNSDTGNNYALHGLGGTGSGSPYSESSTSRGNIQFAAGGLAGNTLDTNSFTGSVLDIIDAFSSSKNKTTREFSGAIGSERRVRIGSGLWMNTTPITTLAFSCSANWLAGSRFSLYGVRG